MLIRIARPCLGSLLALPLAALPFARPLSLTRLLPLARILALPLARPRRFLEASPEPLDVRQKPGQSAVLACALPLRELPGLLDVVAQAPQSPRDGLFVAGRVRGQAPANQVRRVLDGGGHLGLLHFHQRVQQRLRCLVVSSAKRPRLALQPLLDFGEPLSHIALLPREVDLFLPRHAGWKGAVLLPAPRLQRLKRDLERFLQSRCGAFLLFGQSRRFLRQLGKRRLALLLPLLLQRLQGPLQLLLGGRRGRAGIAALASAFHFLGGALELLDRLVELLPRSGPAARRALALRTLPALPACLLLAAILAALQLLQLALQVLRLTPQHLLLPALLEARLGTVLRPVGELLLAARELLELLHRLVDLLIDLLPGRAAARLVLVLFQIHFQLEHLGQVARGAATPAAALGHRKLNVDEQVLRAQQELQGLLLRSDGVIQAELRQGLGSRLHERGRLLEILRELGEFRIRLGQLARPRPLDKRLGLDHQRALQLGQHRRALAQLALFAAVLGVPLVDQVPRRENDFLLAARNLVLLLPLPALPARLLGLGEPALVRLDVDEVHVAANLALGVLRNHVVAD